MKRLLGGAAILLFGFALLQSPKNINAISGSWFDSSTTLQAKLVEENTQKPYVNYWSIPCINIQPENCVYSTYYGYITQTSALSLGNTENPVSLYTPSNQKLTGFVAPLPKSNDVIMFNNYINIYRDLPSNISPIYDPILGSIKLNGYKLTNQYYTAENRVKYQDGTDLNNIQRNSFSFSNDGKYTAVNIGKFQAVFNNQTGIARRFGINSISSGGSTSSLSTSLSSDGSAVITSNTLFSDSHYIYDLNNCTVNATTGIEDCTHRDLQPILRQAVPNYKRVELIRFLTDSTIDAYLSIPQDDGSVHINRYQISLPNSAPTNYDYLSIGDSFASGEGAYNYKPVTDIDTNMCHTSLVSYPYLISTQLALSKSESIACSGAKIKDIIQENPKILYKNDNPQAKDKDDPSFDSEIFGGFLPGYRRQEEFPGKYKPAIITLSIGGNDINFGDKLQYCIITPYSCYNTPEDRQKILKEVKNQFPRLVKTYQTLKQDNPFTRIYVIGYPKIVKPGGDCATNVRLSNEELQLAEDIETDLNTMIRLATEKAGVFYVDTSDAFVGSRLCEDSSWNLAVNGITAGNDKFLPFNLGPLGNETYHPNKLGHIKFRGAITSKTSNLTNPMPRPNDGINTENMPSLLVPENTDLSTLATPILEDKITQDMITSGSSVNTQLTDLPYYLKPGSTFRVEVHSDPIEIGSAIASGMNSLSINASLPADLEPGPHSLHLIGTDINDEPIDIYKDITVIKSQEDFDGDGILNSEDKCQFIQPIGVDSDKDGLDDGCDPEITEPPVVVPPPDPTPPPTKPPISRIKLLVFKLVKMLFNLLLSIFHR